MTGRVKRKKNIVTTDHNNTILIYKEDIEKIWKKYINELFDYSRVQTIPDFETNEGLDILGKEVEGIIKSTKIDKVSGGDQIVKEHFK